MLFVALPLPPRMHPQGLLAWPVHPPVLAPKKGEERHEKEAMGREEYRKMKREEQEERGRERERNKRHEMGKGIQEDGERGTQAR